MAGSGATTGKRQGKTRQHDVAEFAATGTMVFGYFLPKQKAARVVGPRGKGKDVVADARDKNPFVDRNRA